MMTVKELREQLAGLPPHIEIYFADEQWPNAYSLNRVRHSKEINQRVIDTDGRTRRISEGVFVTP